uniref:NADH-ubiquinone oxidoreductase chain 2 n=1 Tax=Ornithodoros rostratus TaxID=360320 RepID=W0FDL4_ORNRO|nr:NADH dehydrogenase subunit 2 [Ornithodoros rostratus]AHF21665.1 NADH dehydrogenase subunit 2 [Ornithodoros rostratus]
MKISYIMLLWVMILSILMAFSSSSLIFLWMCLEINMMSFIPVLNSKTTLSINSTVIYFIIQALASSLFIFIMTIFLMNNTLFMYMKELFTCTMLLKLGAAPFHSWFPQISEGINLTSFFLLTTIQKMIPFYVISLFFSKMIFLTILCSTIFGSLGGFNQTSFRKLLAFSSITHMAWMLSLILMNNLWILYLLIYSIIMGMIIKTMFQFNMNFVFQIKNLNKIDSLYLIVILLSLGGLPPMMGFFMKWMTLKMIILNKMSILIIPLISSSLVNLYFYTRMIYPILLKSFNFNMWNTKSFNKLNLYLITNLIFIFFLIPMM